MDGQSPAENRGPYLSKVKVAKRYDTTCRSIDRWRGDPDLGFPEPLDINGRIYFSEPELIAWERKRAARAVAARPAKGVVLQRHNRSVASAAIADTS
jgi:hypothetical protein